MPAVTGPTPAQPGIAVFAIRLLFGLVPVVTLLAGLILAYF